MIKSTKVLAVGMVAALGIAACGSDDDGDAAEDDSATTEAADEAATTEAADEAATTEAAEGDEAATTEAADGGGEAAGPEGNICEVTDVGGVDDKGFNQLAFEGAEQAAENLGVEAEVLESASDADYAANIQSFIEADCALIVTVGFLLQDATAEAAANNPDQQFAIIDVVYEEPIDNVLTLNFDVAEPSFVAGYLSAGMTESGTIATYGGINIPPVTVFMDGYVKGAEYYNEQKGTDVTTLGWDGSDGTFAGNFENLDDGKNIASSFADEGADIIFPVAGPVGLGSSAFAAETDGIRIIGVDSDGVVANEAEAQVYLTSVLKNIDQAVIAAAEQVIGQGEFGGEYVGTLENDGVGIAPYHEQEGDVPDELKTEVEDLIAALIAGDVTVD